MRIISIIATLLFAAVQLNAQLFDFAHTNYFICQDSVAVNGSTLIATDINLVDFNFNTAPEDHPLFNNGVYFPINDCAGHNLWLRVKHVAADPNGTENGFNIQQSMNSPFLPAGASDRIGGWNGFLYDFQIFDDVGFNDDRQNVINGSFPIQIVVESLETLYNDGGQMFEWLSFEILNNESEGWQLLSTNFTGINPQSNPGFCSEIHYSTPVDWGMAPAGFSTDFPAGSLNIYAVDLNLSAAFHSEFRMSANLVSHFRYGYEFTSGGYQGMSMTFGGEPTIIGTISNQCGEDANGSISLISTGPQPFIFDWGDGITGPVLDGLFAGVYSVTLTDGTGCMAEASFEIVEATPVYVSLEVSVDTNGIWLIANPDGGNGEYNYDWNTGSVNDSLFINSTGTYSITVSSDNGCSATASYDYVGFNSPEIKAQSIYPNPASSIVYANVPAGSTIKIYNNAGMIAHSELISKKGISTIDLSGLESGIYFVKISSPEGNTSIHKLIIIN
ncbi:MAG: T9SS type A sorting domain-containing protein [Bacteroidia bacterium]